MGARAEGPGAGQAESKQPWRGSVPPGTWPASPGPPAGNTASPGLVQPGGRRGAELRTCQERLAGLRLLPKAVIIRETPCQPVFPLPPPMHTAHTHHMHTHTQEHTLCTQAVCTHVTHPHIPHTQAHYAHRLCVDTSHTHTPTYTPHTQAHTLCT